MEFQLINPGDPEQVFITVRNTSGAATVVGDACVYDYTTIADGVAVILPTTALLGCPAGIWVEAVADDGYGRVQVWGHTATMAMAITTVEIAAGTILTMADGAEELIPCAAAETVAPVVAVLGETYAINTVAGTAKGFVTVL